MQAVSPLRLSNKDGNLEIMNSFHMGADEFPDFSSGNLLDSIDFDEIFVGMHDGSVDHVLPDLEMDSDLLAEFSASAGEESEVSLDNNIISDNKVVLERGDIDSSKEVEGEETTRFGGKEGEKSAVSDCSSKKRKKKTSSQRKRNQKSNNDNNNNNDNNQGKRKTKVDWTPELHRRFVQAVEQLGVDKAVPSRILELMGIDCLTRHNVASHLQKYRSHRKHLLAREAEAACLSQKRHMYGVAVGGGGGGGGGKGSRTNLNPWHAPTMGYPPPPMAPMHHHFRPLHVWGHPTGDRHLAVMPAMWPKHVLPQSLSPSTPLPATWASPPTHPPPTSPHFWHSIHHARFGATAPMAGIPPPPPPSHALYRPQPPPFHLPPGKEEGIDEAIGEVLEKPWLPLPIGLKPPSTDGVVAELLRQGIPTIPPNSTTSSSLL